MAIAKTATTVASNVAKDIPVVGGAVSKAISSVTEKSDPQKDAERDAQTNAAYQKALTGDVLSIAYLRARGAKVPAVTLPGYGLVGNWPGDHAPAYARTKYLAIEATPSLARQVDQAKQYWSSQGLPTSTVGSALAAPSLGGLPLWGWIVIGVVAAILLWKLVLKK